MLNSCGHALSQRDGTDFHPRCNWEATPLCYSTCMRVWRRLAPCHGATPAQTYYGSPVKLEELGMLAGVTDGRRSRKWGCRGRLAMGFKPRHSSHTRERGPCRFGGQKREDYSALAEKGEGTMLLWQSGDPMVATQLMVPGA